MNVVFLGGAGRRRPARGEPAVWVGPAARPRAATLRRAARAYRGELVVGVVRDAGLRWHQHERAALRMRSVRRWRAGGLRVRIPARLAGRRIWVWLWATDASGRLLRTEGTGALARAGGTVVVGGPPGGEPVVRFEPGPARRWRRVELMIVEVGVSEAEADRSVPLELPGLTRYDARRGCWIDVQTDRPIGGRQSAPVFRRATPALRVGTAGQVRRWRRHVRAGRAFGVRIDPDEI